MESDKQKNVCMIAYSNYKTDSRIRREAETLAQYGANVTMLCLAESKKPKTTIFNGVTIREIGLTKFKGKNQLLYIFSYIVFLIKSFIVCTDMTLKGKIDVVHVHNMPDFLVFAAIVPRLSGKTLVLDIHDSMLETYQGKFGKLNPLFATLLKIEEKISCALAHKIVCVNHIQMIPVMERGVSKEKITILMNVPDHKIFITPEADHRTGKTSQFKCVYHGTLDKMLGIDLAIKAVENVTKNIPEIKFTIVGAGKDIPEFERYINENNLTRNISLSRDTIRVDKLRPILLEMDLGIIPNRKNVATEYMLPVKLLEYVSLRIPVVAPKLRTIMHYFSKDMIRFYEPESIESLSEAISDIYSRPDRGAEQAECALKMLDKYGWDNHKYDLIEMYGMITGVAEEPVTQLGVSGQS